MTESEFAKILVEEIINKQFDVKTIHHLWESCGLNRFNLQNNEEIWKWYIYATLHWGGVSDDIVHTNFKALPPNSMLCDRKCFVDTIAQLSKLKCFANFTRNCRIKYKQDRFLNRERCYSKDNFEDCPMPKITKDLSWHRHHYKTSKILLESAKRLFILNDAGKIDGNLNDIVSAVFEKRRNSGDNWRANATEEFFKIFEDMAHYPSQAKSLLMFISDMSMPFMQVNHWPAFDFLTLIPVDIHVGRLSHRFAFIETETKIKEVLRKLYPKNPRLLNFAMFRLGAKQEMNICTKVPKCDICRIKIPKVYHACPYPDKL